MGGGVFFGGSFILRLRLGIRFSLSPSLRIHPRSPKTFNQKLEPSIQGVGSYMKGVGSYMKGVGSYMRAWNFQGSWKISFKFSGLF